MIEQAAPPGHQNPSHGSSGFWGGLWKTVRSIAPMAAEIIAPIVGYLAVYSFTKRGLLKRVLEQKEIAPEDRDKGLVELARKYLTPEELQSIGGTSNTAGIGIGLVASAVSTLAMFKELVGNPDHFQQEPAGKMVNWVGRRFGRDNLVNDMLVNTSDEHAKAEGQSKGGPTH